MDIFIPLKNIDFFLSINTTLHSGPLKTFFYFSDGQSKNLANPCEHFFVQINLMEVEFYVK